MKRILILMCAMVMAGSASGTQVNLSLQSLPYAVQTNDTVTVDGGSGTSTKLTTTGDFLSLTGNITGWLIDIDNDSLLYDIDSTGGDYGIFMTNSGSNRPNNGRIRGDLGVAFIGSPIQLSHGRNSTASSAPTTRHALWIRDGYNITIDSINFRADGHNIHVVEFGAVGMGNNSTYNILFNNCTFSSWSESYSDRETYTGACVYTDNLLSTSGNYNVRFVDCQVLKTPHIGYVCKGGAFQIVGGSIVGDGKNTYWDTTDCYDNAAYCASLSPPQSAPCCNVGQSTGNAYAILFRNCTQGCVVDGVDITSGTARYGCRGIMMEGFLKSARSGDSVVIANNDIEISEGKTGEAGSGQDGNCRIIRIRRVSNPLGALRYLMHHNEITGFVDKDTSTHHIGGSTVGFHLGTSAGDSCGIYIYANTFTAKSLTSNTGALAYNTYLASAPPATGSIAGYFDSGNTWIGSRNCLEWGDRDNGSAGSGFTIIKGTFQALDTNAVGNESAFVVQFGTFHVGYANYNALSNVIRDGVYSTVSGYTNQASDTNIIFTGSSGQASLRIDRTLTVDVDDVDGDAVNGAQIVVQNAYGNTIATVNTNASGLAYPVFSSWYEENNHPTSDDSLGYSPATLIAWYDADGDLTQEDSEDDTLSQTVTATSYTFNFDLTGVNIGGGTPPDTTVTIVTPSGTTVNEGAIASLVFSRNVTTGTAAYTVNFFDSTALAGAHYTDATVSAEFASGSALDTVTLQTLVTVGADSIGVRYCRATASGLPTNYVFANGISSAYIGIANISRYRQLLFRE